MSAGQLHTVGVQMWTHEQLRQVLRFEDLIDPMRDAFIHSSHKQVHSGMLTMFPGATAEHGDVYVKSGYRPGARYHLVKVSPWFARNVEMGLPQGGFVAVLDSLNGRTIALIDDQHLLSDLRTAAAGAVVADALAPDRIRVAGVLGAGTQAELQARALFHVRPYAELLIWARDARKANGLKLRLARQLPAVSFRVCSHIEDVVEVAEVLLCCTQSKNALVKGSWLRPGMHITAVGADDATKCELDVEALQRARVFVDSREAASENGDVHQALRTGAYSLAALAGEIGDVLDGSVPARLDPLDITIAKLVGIGAQDLAAAEVAVDKLSMLTLTVRQESA